MILGKDVYTIHNVPFAGAGEMLDDFWIERIRNFFANGQIKNGIHVLKEAGQPQDLLELE